MNLHMKESINTLLYWLFMSIGNIITITSQISVSESSGDNSPFLSTTVSLQSSKCQDIVSYFILQFWGESSLRQKNKSICQYENPNAKNSSAVEFRNPWGLYGFNCGDISLGYIRILHFCHGCIHIVISCSYISLLHAKGLFVT